MKSLELLKNEINLQLFNELFDNSNEYSISFFYNNFVKNPKETLYHVCSLLDKNIINEELFFQIIDSFIAKKNYEKFLLEYLFLSFKPLNDYIIFKIEIDIFNKLLKFLKIENKKLNNIKNIILNTYYENLQVKDCIFFIQQHNLKSNYSILDIPFNGYVSDFEKTKHYKLKQLSIYSALISNRDFQTFIKYFFEYIPQSLLTINYREIDSSTTHFNLQNIDSEIKECAYLIYKNCNPILSNFSSYFKKEYIYLFSLCHDLLSQEEISIFFKNVNQNIDFSSVFCPFKQSNMNSEHIILISKIIYLSFKYQSELDFYKLLFNRKFIVYFLISSLILFSKEDYQKISQYKSVMSISQILNLFFNSFEYNNNKIISTVIVYDNCDFNLKYFHNKLFINSILNHIKYLEIELYHQLIDTYPNNYLLKKHYYQTQIENF